MQQWNRETDIAAVGHRGWVRERTMPNGNGNRWINRLGTVALAFRGYNITNLGRTPELLEHPVYGPTVAQALREASAVCSEATGQKVDLVQRVARREETPGLNTYAQDVALIVGVQKAQVELLGQHFGFSLPKVPVMFGYSLGEAAALVIGGVYAMGDLLMPPLRLADDVVALADDVTMGVLFSRGPSLEYSQVERLCLEITQRGAGTIAISAQLSPNTVLLLGQGNTLAQFRKRMRGVLPESTHLRKNPHRWPPLHTPITWQRCISDRAAVMLQTTPGGFRKPVPPVLSGVTGAASYDEINSRELLHCWIDHPQRLWDLVYETLAMGIETVVHVGPAPNLIPATFKRLADNVKAQLAGNSWSSFGLRTVSRIARRRVWLTNLISSRTAILRAPFIEQVILEDWLLENAPR